MQHCKLGRNADSHCNIASLTPFIRPEHLTFTPCDLSLKTICFCPEKIKNVPPLYNGQSPHTSEYHPWKIITYHAFADVTKVAAFEKYLKSGPGLAFSNKHF